MHLKKNTYKSGTLHFIFFKSKRNTHLAACVELCIVKEDKDDELTKFQAIAAAKEYLEMVCLNKLGEHLLNQELPEEIIEEFVEHARKTKLKEVDEKTFSFEDLFNKSEKTLLKCLD